MENARCGAKTDTDAVRLGLEALVRRGPTNAFGRFADPSLGRARRDAGVNERLQPDKGRHSFRRQSRREYQSSTRKARRVFHRLG